MSLRTLFSRFLFYIHLIFSQCFIVFIIITLLLPIILLNQSYISFSYRLRHPLERSSDGSDVRLTDADNPVRNCVHLDIIRNIGKDHFVDLHRDLVIQALSKLHQQERNKRRIVLKPGKSDETLVMRILRDLLQRFS